MRRLVFVLMLTVFVCGDFETGAFIPGDTVGTEEVGSTSGVVYSTTGVKLFESTASDSSELITSTATELFKSMNTSELFETQDTTESTSTVSDISELITSTALDTAELFTSADIIELFTSAAPGTTELFELPVQKTTKLVKLTAPGTSELTALPDTTSTTTDAQPDELFASGTCAPIAMTQSGGVLFEELTDAKVLQFKASGSVTFATAVTVDVLVVGGGGSGTTHIGAGGGAGAVIFYQGAVLAANTPYSVTVGAGGVHNTAQETPGVNGGASSIGSLFTAIGGGGAGIWTTNRASDGGSGGGGGACNGMSTGAGFCSSNRMGGNPLSTNTVNGVGSLGPASSQYVFGKSGGKGYILLTPNVDAFTLNCGGGGGAGGNGADYNSVSNSCGVGGAGLNSINIAGSNTLFGSVFGQAYSTVAQTGYIAAGGGGGGWAGTSGQVVCAGGVGGGGQGGKAGSGTCATYAATSGLANTGSGGGGAGDSCQGGDGGSGLVLIRYGCNCAAGSYTPVGFGSCIPCETGTYTDTASSVVCKQCDVGRYSSSDGSTQCPQCPAGKFSFFPGSSVCSSCPAWTGSAVGMASCVTCYNATTGCSYADGSACPLCGSACAQCNAGYYNDGGSSRCLACGAGKYLSGKGAVSSAVCTDCFSGTYTRPISTGMTACLSCSGSAMSLPQNAAYSASGSGFNPLVCSWVCDAGFQTMLASPSDGSDAWNALYTSYTSQGFSASDIVLMIKYRSDYCCDASTVTVGSWRTGCTKYSAGTISACPAIANGQFFLSTTDSLNRCNDWVCNAGYYKLDGVCNLQPACAAGSTYARDSGGQLITQSDIYSCVTCPVCVDGSETAVGCNRTHSAVCRMCGGDKQFSVGGGPCLKDPPFGFRGVKKTYSNSLAWGVQPVLTYDNKVFVWAPSTVFYSYVVCAGAGYGRNFTGGDAVCNLATDSFCDQCSTQCSSWKRSIGWFQGVGWYGGVSCTACQFDSTLCANDQYLDMSVCGPVNPVQCASCPSQMPVANQVGWMNPRDVNFNGLFPCRVVCAAGYSEVNDQCAFCQNLPANVILVSGCDWRCKPGYLQNSNNLCDACPAQGDCAVGYYPDYQGSSNVCLSCMGCQKPSNSVFLTAGTFGVASSCAYRCEDAFYRSGDLCVACTQRSCVPGSTFLTACTGVSDSKCTACRSCGVGEQQIQPCTVGNNTVCAACDPTLKPDNSTWTGVGCGTWGCVSGFWKDGSVCRKCSVQKDCGVGTTLQVMASVCSGTTGKCVACPALLAGECYNGDQYCGTTRVCGYSSSTGGVSSSRISSIITPVRITTTRLTSSTAAPPTTTQLKLSSLVMPTSVSLPKSTTITLVIPTNASSTSSQPPPSTTVSYTSSQQIPSTTAAPVAYASLASLTIRPNETVNANLFASLVRDMTVVVCADVVGFCNVSVLAVTVNNVTSFCTDGVCPGYARRRALLVTTMVVVVGVVTQTPIADVTGAVTSIPVVGGVVIMPNSPVSNLTSIQGGSRAIMEQVMVSFTVFNVVAEKVVVVDNGPMIAGIGAAFFVVVVILAVVLWQKRKGDTPSDPLVGKSHNNAGAEAHFTALDSIRITRENYKPYIKTN